MALARTRKGTGVFEEDTLEKKVEDSEGQITPNQKGMLSVGATPKQSEQALAAKQPILREAVAKEETLAGAQRLRGSEEEIGAATEAAKLKAENLQQLGSLGARVQNRIIDQFSALRGQEAGATADEAFIENMGLDVGTVAPKINSLISALGTATTVDESEREDLLAGWQRTNPGIAPSDADLLKQQQSHNIEQALVQLGKAGIPYQDALAMVKMGAEQIGLSAADLVVDSDNFSIGLLFEDDDLEASGFGSFAEMSAALGIPAAELENLTLPEFEQRVEDLRQEEFSKVSATMAQLSATPPGSGQYQLMVDQLRALGMVGETGIEADMTALQEQINSADLLMVGNTAMTVEEILQDQAISDIVTEILDLDPNNLEDATRIAEIEAVYGAEFTGWVGEQEAALSQLANEARLETASFGSVQEQWKNLGNFTDNHTFSQEDLAAMGIDWNGDLPVTAAAAWKMKQKIQESPVYQAMNSNFQDLQLKEGFRDRLANLGVSESQFPGLLTEMKSALSTDALKTLHARQPPPTADELVESFLLSKEAKTGTVQGNVLSELTGGLGMIGDFPDDDTVAQMKEYSAIIAGVPKTINVDGFEEPLGDSWFLSPEWKQLVREDPTKAAELNQFPERFQSAEDFKEETKRIKNLTVDPDTMFREIMGDSSAGWEQDLADLKVKSTWSPTAAKQYSDFMQAYDLDDDGEITATDAAEIKSQISAGHAGQSFQNILKGGDGESTYSPANLSLKYESTSPAEQYISEEVLADGDMDAREFAAAPGDKRALLELYSQWEGADVGPLYEVLGREALSTSFAKDARGFSKLGLSPEEGLQGLAEVYTDYDNIKPGGIFSDSQLQQSIPFLQKQESQLTAMIADPQSSAAERSVFRTELEKIAGVEAGIRTALSKRTQVAEDTEREESKKELHAAFLADRDLDDSGDVSEEEQKRFDKYDVDGDGKHTTLDTILINERAAEADKKSTGERGARDEIKFAEEAGGVNRSILEAAMRDAANDSILDKPQIIASTQNKLQGVIDRLSEAGTATDNPYQKKILEQRQAPYQAALDTLAANIAKDPGRPQRGAYKAPIVRGGFA